MAIFCDDVPLQSSSSPVSCIIHHVVHCAGIQSHPHVHIVDFILSIHSAVSCPRQSDALDLGLSCVSQHRSMTSVLKADALSCWKANMSWPVVWNFLRIWSGKITEIIFWLNYWAKNKKNISFCTTVCTRVYLCLKLLNKEFISSFYSFLQKVYCKWTVYLYISLVWLLCNLVTECFACDSYSKCYKWYVWYTNC